MEINLALLLLDDADGLKGAQGDEPHPVVLHEGEGDRKEPRHERQRDLGVRPAREVGGKKKITNAVIMITNAEQFILSKSNVC